MINKYIIAKLNPCEDRFDNFIRFYGNKSLTKQQFMGLKNITHKDKVWVAFRLMPKENLRFAAADIAELVLVIFEKKYPNDLRPRRAIEAARANALVPETGLADAAYASANAACAAANAAGYDAAYAAYTAAAYTAAGYDAAYAAYTAAAYDAAHAAYAAAYTAAAYTAAHAAYAASHVGYDATYTAAAYTAANAAYAAAAYAAAYDGDYDAYTAANRLDQEKLIRKIMLKYWKNS